MVSIEGNLKHDLHIKSTHTLHSLILIHEEIKLTSHQGLCDR